MVHRADSRHSDPNLIAPLLLAALAHAGVVTATVAAYSRAPWRNAYVLSAPLRVACPIALAEQVGRARPAWS